MTQEAVIEIIERVYGITLEHLQSKKREHYLVMGRIVASYLLVTKCGMSKRDAGRVLGTDHSMVIYYMDRLQQAIDGYDRKLFSFYEQLDPVLSVKINEIYKLKKEVLSNPDKTLIEILKQYIQENENKEIKS